MAKPSIIDIDTLIQAGINPKTGLPIKFGNKRCTTKEDIKRAIRKNDEQIFVNRYTWYNLPMNLTGAELERMLYYKGQLAFFYLKDLDEFYFMPYALDGTIDFYGRFNTIHPVPMTAGTDDKASKSQAQYLSNIKLNCVYGIKLPEDLKESDLTDSAVLLHDYSKQLSQTISPTQQINDPIIDLEAECMPYLRTALLMGTGVKGIRVADADQADSVREGARSMINAAIASEPYVPVTGSIEFQELTDGTVAKAQEFLMSMQSIDNFRLGLHGVQNGGLFEKSQYVNNSQTDMNYAGGDIGLTLQDGLSIRQSFCNIVNSIWGLGIWCDVSENLVAQDLNGDGKGYDSDEDGNNASYEGGEE